MGIVAEMMTVLQQSGFGEVVCGLRCLFERKENVVTKFAGKGVLKGLIVEKEKEV